MVGGTDPGEGASHRSRCLGSLQTSLVFSKTLLFASLFTIIASTSQYASHKVLSCSGYLGVYFNCLQPKNLERYAVFISIPYRQKETVWLGGDLSNIDSKAGTPAISLSFCLCNIRSSVNYCQPGELTPLGVLKGAVLIATEFQNL